jgi:protein involved in polysaccharide export with SLBB domain
MHIAPLMKIKAVRFWIPGLFLVATLLALGLAGCATEDKAGLMDPPTDSGKMVLPKLVVGDTVTVTLTGIDTLPGPQEKPIRDDGTIALPEIGSVQAAGKTPGDLETIIHDLYVPKHYTHMDVTVKRTSDSVYYVRGEVHQPGRMIYTGPITVTKSITSAGDFTDFANRSKVYLIRATGRRYRLDCDRILNGGDPDPPVYPGDQIEVKRKIL